MPAPEVRPQQEEDHADREHQEQHDLKGVFEDPADEDRDTRDVNLVVFVFDFGLDLLNPIEDRHHGGSAT